jgi:hypothetical protein
LIHSSLDRLKDCLTLQNLFHYKVDKDASSEIKTLNELITKCVDFCYSQEEDFQTKLRRKQKELGLPKILFPYDGIEDGWRVAYRIMNVIAVNYDLIVTLQPDDTTKDDSDSESATDLPTRDELKIIKEFLQLLKPLYEASELITKIQFTPMSNILPSIYSYLNLFLKHKTFESELVEKVKTTLGHQLAQSFKFMLDSPDMDFYFTCTFLDPKYKSFAFLQDQALIDQHHAKVWANLKANFDQPEKLSELEKEFNEYKGLQLETSFVSTFYQKHEATFPLLSVFAKKMLLIVANPVQSSYYFGDEITVHKNCSDDPKLMELTMFLLENGELIKNELKDFQLESVEEVEAGLDGEDDDDYDDEEYDEDESDEEYDEDDDGEYDSEYDSDDEWGMGTDDEEAGDTMLSMLMAMMMQKGVSGANPSRSNQKEIDAEKPADDHHSNIEEID